MRWKAKHLGVVQHFTSKITAYERPGYFQDTMTEGAFQFFQHDHYFSAIKAGMTEMRDVLNFAAPIPLLGLIAETLVLKRYMTSFLRQRNNILRQIAESERWKEFLRV